MNKKNLKKGLLIFVCIALLLWICSLFKDSQTTQNSIYENDVQVYLWNNKNASEEENQEDLDTLKKRLKQLFKSDYNLEEKDDYMILTYPKSLSGNNDPYDFLEGFLLEPEDYNITVEGDSQEGVLNNKTIYYLKRSDYESVEKTDSREIKITFSQEVGDALQDYRDSGKEMYLQNTNIYEDYDTNDITYSGYVLTPDENDSYVYYITFDEGMSDSLMDMLVYNLKEDGLHYPYNYKIIYGDTKWQDISENEIVGINQCNEEDIPEDYYMINYSLGKRLTNEEFQTMESVLKNRLDALDSKYAFGNDSNKYFSVKITPEHINDTLITTLANENTLRLLYDGKVISLSGEEGSNTFEYDPSGPSIHIMFGDAEDIQNKLSKPGKTLYLAMNDHVLSSMELTQAFDSDELTFTDFEQISASDSNSSWLKNYLDAIFSDRLENYGISLDDYYYENISNYKDGSHFGLSYPEKYYKTSDIEQITKGIYPEASVEFSMGESLIKIKFHHDTDENLLKDTLPAVQEIYKAMDFENTAFENVYFYLYDSELDERSWLVFDKGEAGVHFLGCFRGGRSEKYQEELQDFIEKDTFFPQYYDEKDESSTGGWWTNDF